MRPVLALGLIIVALWTFIALIRPTLGSMRTLLFAPIVCGLFAFTWIEMLSLVEGIRPWTLAFPFLVTIAIAGFRWRALGLGSRVVLADALGAARGLWGRRHDPLCLSIRLTSILSGGIVGITTFLAIWGPPNNFDSMTYHLPRIMHWLQNNDVGYYSAITERQLTTPPLGEYLMMFTFALSGGDFLANVVQLCAFLVSILVIAAITWILFNSRVASATATLFAVATPMAIAEATTTQVDLISTIWVLLGVLSVVGYYRNRWGIRSSALTLSATCLLAATTKPIGLVELIPVLAWFSWLVLSDRSVRPVKRVLCLLLAGMPVAMGVFIGLLPQTIRNLERFGNVIDTETGLTTGRLGWDITLGNAMRYLVNNIGLPKRLNEYITPQITNLSSTLGINWTDTDAVGYGHVAAFSFGRNEDYATSPAQLVLGLAVAIVLLLLVRSRLPGLKPLIIVIVSMFLLNAAVWKWNLWANRFIIPILLLLCVPLGVAVALAADNKGWMGRAFRAVASVTLIAATLYALLFVLQLQYRRILPTFDVFVEDRVDRSFTSPIAPIKDRYLEVVDQVRALPAGSVIGLRFGGDSWEYPLWALANPDGRYVFQVMNGPRVASDPPLLTPVLTVCLDVCSPNEVPEGRILNIND